MTETILQREISEQPAVLRALLEHEHSNVATIAQALHRQFDYILIAARGTSDNAARYAQYLFGAHNQIQVALATPSLFTLYKRAPRLANALVVGISQSGQSPDIVAVLAEGRRQGCPTLAITNDACSPLAQTADFLLPLHAAPELAVAATKTYTASLAALALLSASLAGNEDHLRALDAIPQAMEDTFVALRDQIRHVERYRFMESCSVIGRGYNYATVFEIALKIKELTQVVAEPYSSADFRHGPIATITRGSPAILVAPRGAVHDDMAELIERLKALRAELLIISDEQALLKQAHLPLPIPQGVPEWLTPLVAVLPGQLFAMQLTKEKGMSTDAPDGLTKVTETY